MGWGRADTPAPAPHRLRRFTHKLTHHDDGAGGIRVVDLSSEIAGPYCSKVSADAGADVVKVETPDGDPLRAYTATGADLGGHDSALFLYLNTSKRSVVGKVGEAHVEHWQRPRAS